MLTYHNVHIGNVRGSTTEDDIITQLRSMGVRLRYRHMFNIYFRVFIVDQHIDQSLYKECWYGNINVEPYRVGRNTRHQLNVRSSESKQMLQRQHSSNDSTHRASNRSKRSRYSRAPCINIERHPHQRVDPII